MIRLAISCASSLAVVVSFDPAVPMLEFLEERAVMGFSSRIEEMRRTTSDHEIVWMSAYRNGEALN